MLTVGVQGCSRGNRDGGSRSPSRSSCSRPPRGECLLARDVCAPYRSPHLPLRGVVTHGGVHGFVVSNRGGGRVVTDVTCDIGVGYII